MKLLYITNAINGSGGLERVLATKASYFAEMLNYEVIIVVLNDGSVNPFFPFSSKIKFINIVVEGNPIKYIKSYKYGIKEAVKSVKPDIIMVCDDGLKAFFIPQILKQFHIPIIYERHVSKLIELPFSASLKSKIIAKCKWYLMDKLAKNFDAFVVLTDGNKQEWKHLNNLYTIPNPLPRIPQEQSDLTQKRIICVGKVSVQKGQDILARVWSKLNIEFPDWELHNFGKLEDAFLSSNNLPQKMFLHPPTSNIEAEYLKSSIYVLPSRYEGFGMVLIEAMSFGIPCIAFDCNYGPADIIGNGEDGLIVNVEDEIALESALRLMMKDEGKRVKMGKQAKYNINKYHIELISTKWQQLWNSLVVKRK